MSSQITTWGHPLAPGNFILKRPVVEEFMGAVQEANLTGQVPCTCAVALLGFTAFTACQTTSLKACNAVIVPCLLILVFGGYCLLPSHICSATSRLFKCFEIKHYDQTLQTPQSRLHYYCRNSLAGHAGHWSWYGLLLIGCSCPRELCGSI